MRQFLYKILFVFSFGIILPQMVFAAQINLSSDSQNIRIGEQFEVKLFVNTPEESINAIEGQVVFPADLLELKEIQDGNSIINFWIEKPKIEADKIFFSGIIPGGFQGKNSLILSMLFRTKKSDDGSIAIQDIKVLKNDGAGTPAEVTTSDFQFSVSEKISAVVPQKEKDHEPPETFRPEIARDESLFVGKWFLVFATQDKSSGIDHYEVKESRQKFFTVLKKWLPVESPHILQDQELRSYVFVKAVDNNGNQRIIKIAPRNPLLWYENYENWSIIMVGALAVLFATKKLWRKKRT